MRTPRWSVSVLRNFSALLIAAGVGACAATAIQSKASDSPPVDEAADASATMFAGNPRSTAGVRPTADAPRARSPSGSATITHLARGESAYLGKLEMRAGASVPDHRDPTDEYVHILSGSGTVTIDGTRHEVGTGGTIFMPAGARVSFENGPETLTALQVFAGPAPAAKYDAWSPIVAGDSSSGD